MESKTLEFYKECVKNKLFNLDDDYEGQKINLLAKKYGVTSSQISKEQFEKIKSECEAFILSEEEKAKLEKLESKKKSEIAAANSIDSTYIRFNDIRSKRKQELQKLVKRYEIYDKTSDEQFQQILFKSHGGEKKANPYIMGGLAEGIGGMGVGLATFADTVAENAKIDVKNRKAAENAAAEWLTTSKDTVYIGRYKYRYYKTQLENVDTTYVSDNHELAKYLLAKIDYSISETGCITLNLIISVDPKFEADISRDVPLAIDGNFTLGVWNKDEVLALTTVQLPTFGVPVKSDGEKSVYVKVKKIIPEANLSNKTKYKFFIADNNLSLIETEFEAFMNSQQQRFMWDWIESSKLKSYWTEKDLKRKEELEHKNAIRDLGNATYDTDILGKKSKLPWIVGVISVVLPIIAYISARNFGRITNLWLYIAILGMICLSISGFTQKKAFALVYPGGCAAITIYYSILSMTWYNVLPAIVWIVLLVSVILWILPNQRLPLGRYLWIISAGLQLMYLFLSVKDMVAYQFNVYFLVWLIIELVAIVILGLWIYNDYKVSG